VKFLIASRAEQDRYHLVEADNIADAQRMVLDGHAPLVSESTDPDTVRIVGAAPMPGS
jgi:hypothetical protein